MPPPSTQVAIHNNDSHHSHSNSTHCPTIQKTNTMKNRQQEEEEQQQQQQQQQQITLLVIGMQNDKYTASSAMLSMGKGRILTCNVNKCIETAIQNQWNIVYALDLHHPKHSSFEDYGGLYKPHCILATMGSYHVSALHFAVPGSEMVTRGVDMDGDSNDAFWITDPSHTTPCESRLRSILMKQQQQSADAAATSTTSTANHMLFLCGTSPDGCIESTAATASRLGFTVCIIKDATCLVVAEGKQLGVDCHCYQQQLGGFFHIPSSSNEIQTRTLSELLSMLYDDNDDDDGM